MTMNSLWLCAVLVFFFNYSEVQGTRNFVVRINDGKDVCLGTVLTPWKIVTSASCLYKKESVTLLVGPITSAEPVYSVNLTKGELYPHPRFDEKYPYVNNIGMIELSDTHRLKYDRNVGGIGWVDLLYKGPNNGEPVTIIQPDGKNPNVFRYTGSRLMDYDRCRKSYVAHFKRTFGGEYESLEEGRDLCVNSNGVANGVTGGPVITERNKYLGSVIYNAAGQPQLLTLFRRHRDFIDTPRVYVPPKQRR